MLRWKLTSRAEPSPEFIDDVTEFVPPQRVEGGELRVTLVNHSTVLLQAAGVNILTDPMWSERASPFSWIGPRRHRRPGVRQQHLPPIDIVLLSHNHYDHLDLATLRWLARRGESAFVAPLGLERLLSLRGIGPAHELDWGEAWRCDRVTIHCVPALHFASRTLFDHNRTLWCGYVIEYRNRKVYFAGDTGFGAHFRHIREVFGAPSVALLPIGSYQPRWFMSAIHMAPEDAVQAHQVLGARISVAIHHGTFQLGDDGIDKAKHELLRCAPADSFLVLHNGESFIIAE